MKAKIDHDWSRGTRQREELNDKSPYFILPNGDAYGSLWVSLEGKTVLVSPLRGAMSGELLAALKGMLEVVNAFPLKLTGREKAKYNRAVKVLAICRGTRKGLPRARQVRVRAERNTGRPGALMAKQRGCLANWSGRTSASGKEGASLRLPNELDEQAEADEAVRALRKLG